LPEPWQALSQFNPILYMVNGFRYGLLGHSDVDLGLAYAIMLLAAAALYAFSISLLKRGVGLRS
jgi:ABC-2 type transport system permease protein